MAIPRHEPGSASRVSEYRSRMRRRGMRLVQFWVPDVRSEDFQSEAHRQSVLVGSSPSEADDQGFIDALSIDVLDPDEG